MKLVNLMAGRLDVAWDLLRILALNPRSLLYWPGLFMLDLCDKSGCGTSHQGWGPLQATSFSSAAGARTHVARFSTSSTNILQFLYLRASSAEFLPFTNSDQSSQGKFTAVCFLQRVVLRVLF